MHWKLTGCRRLPSLCCVCAARPGRCIPPRSRHTGATRVWQTGSLHGAPSPNHTRQSVAIYIHVQIRWMIQLRYDSTSPLKEGQRSGNNVKTSLFPLSDAIGRKEENCKRIAHWYQSKLSWVKDVIPVNACVPQACPSICQRRTLLMKCCQKEHTRMVQTSKWSHSHSEWH